MSVVTLIFAASCASAPASVRDEPSAEPGSAADILARIDSSRLGELSASDNLAIVVGTASSVDGDATRTLWYESIAAAALAQTVPVDLAQRQVLDESGNILETEEDPVTTSEQDAFAQLNLSADEIAGVVAPGAKAMDVQVVSIEYIELFGGIAEIVVLPGDVAAFVASAGTNIPVLLDRLIDGHQPYLVTVVDGKQDPQLVLGWTPGIGGDGQGIGWVSPDLETDSIWGQPPSTQAEEEG
jgi:hypothetical protein